MSLTGVDHWSEPPIDSCFGPGLQLEIATLVVDGRPETGQKLRGRLLLETYTDDDAKFLFEPVCSLTATARFEVAPNPPGSKRRQFSVEIAVDIVEGVIAVLAHVGLLICACPRFDNFGVESVGVS